MRNPSANAVCVTTSAYPGTSIETRVAPRPRAGLGATPLFRRGQSLSQEMLAVVGRVVEPSELIIAELPVETGRLKTECVDPCGVAATVPRPDLGLDHQPAADTATAQTLGYPQISDEEPSAIRLAGETGNDLSFLSEKNRERTPRW